MSHDTSPPKAWRSLDGTAVERGDARNTPADGPYPYVQPGVDDAEGRTYCETSMVPRRFDFPEAGRNRKR